MKSLITRCVGDKRPFKALRSYPYHLKWGISENSRKARKETEATGIFWVSNARFARVNRLLFSGARFIFNMTRLLVSYYYIPPYEFISDIILTVCLMLWDFVGSINSRIVIPRIIISIEVIISLSVLIVMCLELSYHSPGSSYGASGARGEVPIALLWIHFLILSCIIIYQISADYVRQRRNPKPRPVIVFTEMGDPVVVIPRAQSSDDAAELFSIDTFIQVPDSQNPPG